jgi:ABC-type amino acid transport substrate-binding protein
MPSFEPLVPGRLTVCTYPRFAPFCYLEGGEIVGTDIELLTRFAASQGVRARFVDREFPDIWTRPGRDECDVAAAGIAALARRELGPGGRWSEPYGVVRRSLLIRSDDGEQLGSPADFAGRTIVVTRDSTAEGDARRRYPRARVLPELSSQDAVVKRLLAGTIDAYAGGETSNRFVAASEPRLDVVDVHEMEPPETLHFAVRGADPRLLESLDAFIHEHAGTHLARI